MLDCYVLLVSYRYLFCLRQGSYHVRSFLSLRPHRVPQWSPTAIFLQLLILRIYAKYIRYKFSAFFRYAYPSSSWRCSRKRPSLLSLACASGRLSFAVGERYCVYFLSAISFHVRTYADVSLHITIQARSTNTRFTYVQSSTFIFIFDVTYRSCVYENSIVLIQGALQNRTSRIVCVR